MTGLSFTAVEPDDRRFKAGRTLAKQVYHTAWGTPIAGMPDDYDAAVVAEIEGLVVGNINLQFARNRVLPSEKYFGPDHWVTQSPDAERSQLAELCSMSVPGHCTARQRIAIFRGLIIGAHMLGLEHGASLFATVQRPELITTLTRLHRYPFFAAEQQQRLLANCPQDQYWQTGPGPGLYYVDISSRECYAASMNMLNLLWTDGMSFQSKPALRKSLPPVPA